MKALDIIIRVRDIIADPRGERWDDARVIRILNEAQRNLCSRTNILKKSINIIAMPEQSNYVLPKDVLMLEKVYYDDKMLVISKDVNNLPPVYGTPEYCIPSINKNDIITLYPIPKFDDKYPSKLEDKKFIRIFYSYLPKKIKNMDDETEVPEMYSIPLIKYCAGCLLREDMDTQNRGFGMEELTIYEGWIRKIQLDVGKNYALSNKYSVDYYGGF